MYDIDHFGDEPFIGDEHTPMIRLSIKKRSSLHINEILEMPRMTTLSSLRVFIKQSYPYFPTRYVFETVRGYLIDPLAEKTTQVTDIGANTVYMNTASYKPLPEELGIDTPKPQHSKTKKKIKDASSFDEIVESKLQANASQATKSMFDTQHAKEVPEHLRHVFHATTVNPNTVDMREFRYFREEPSVTVSSVDTTELRRHLMKVMVYEAVEKYVVKIQGTARRMIARKVVRKRRSEAKKRAKHAAYNKRVADGEVEKPKTSKGPESGAQAVDSFAPASLPSSAASAASGSNTIGSSVSGEHAAAEKTASAKAEEEAADEYGDDDYEQEVSAEEKAEEDAAAAAAKKAEEEAAAAAAATKAEEEAAAAAKKAEEDAAAAAAKKAEEEAAAAAKKAEEDAAAAAKKAEEDAATAAAKKAEEEAAAAAAAKKAEEEAAAAAAKKAEEEAAAAAAAKKAEEELPLPRRLRRRLPLLLPRRLRRRLLPLPRRLRRMLLQLPKRLRRRLLLLPRRLRRMLLPLPPPRKLRRRLPPRLRRRLLLPLPRRLRRTPLHL